MIRWIIVAVLATLSAASAFAGNRMVTSDPQTWRLENYINGGVVVWNADPTCSGPIGFPPSATTADLNRFWSTVSLAKTTGKKMLLQYNADNAPATCTIVSFGLLEGS
jgi:hypothetical protein